jgi:hypothetical protein
VVMGCHMQFASDYHSFVHKNLSAAKSGKGN